MNIRIALICLVATLGCSDKKPTDTQVKEVKETQAKVSSKTTPPAEQPAPQPAVAATPSPAKPTEPEAVQVPANPNLDTELLAQLDDLGDQALGVVVFDPNEWTGLWELVNRFRQLIPPDARPMLEPARSPGMIARMVLTNIAQGENWTQGWDPAIARRSMDQALTQLNNNVQGVVSSNDGNAGAAIAAMEEQGMAGTVPVSGLDFTVQAQQLMLLGKQTQCGWRPLEDMAAAAAQVTVRLVNGEDFSDLAPQTVENGVGATVAYVPVGSYSAVGVDGVAYVIANDASITKEMVCQGEAAETTFCR